MMLGNLLLLCLMFLHVSAAPGPEPDINIKIDINVNGNSVSDSEGGDTDVMVECGIETPYATRIINGEPVNAARKYSWQVGLSIRDNPHYKPFCGGSVITNKHILTAAHCFVGVNIYNFFVGIGTNMALYSSIVIPSAKISIHEDYGDYFDIAIIELSRPIDLVKNGIRPICMPIYGSNDYAGLNATITGWGSIVGYNPNPTPPPLPKPISPIILHEAQVPVLDNAKCREMNVDFRATLELCAGGLLGFENGGKDTCQGDSGGPLTVQSNGQQHQQIGIVAYGYGCASKGNPGVYTRVTAFIGWINDKVYPEKLYIQQNKKT